MNLLQPFIVTAAHVGKEDLSELEPGVREIFTRSELSRDPNRSNVFMFVLDSRGQVVHEFHGLPGRRGTGRSDFQVELSKARTKLKLPETVSPGGAEHGPGLPDLPGPATQGPRGVRIFVRQDDASNSIRSMLPVVEVVPMKTEQWDVLAFTAEGREVDAAALKNWLVWLYPAGIRTADESKRFQQFRGRLRLEPAGSEDQYRYALLRGDVHLAKGDDMESAFEGTLEAVLSYRHDAAHVYSLRGVVEGDYIYRMRSASRQKLSAAIESRPE